MYYKYNSIKEENKEKIYNAYYERYLDKWLRHQSKMNDIDDMQVNFSFYDEYYKYLQKWILNPEEKTKYISFYTEDENKLVLGATISDRDYILFVDDIMFFDVQNEPIKKKLIQTLLLIVEKDLLTPNISQISWYYPDEDKELIKPILDNNKYHSFCEYDQNFLDKGFNISNKNIRRASVLDEGDFSRKQAKGRN